MWVITENAKCPQAENPINPIRVTATLNSAAHESWLPTAPAWEDEELG
jgi:hypothetical protein